MKNKNKRKELVFLRNSMKNKIKGKLRRKSQKIREELGCLSTLGLDKLMVSLKVKDSSKISKWGLKFHRLHRLKRGSPWLSILVHLPRQTIITITLVIKAWHLQFFLSSFQRTATITRINLCRCLAQMPLGRRVE